MASLEQLRTFLAIYRAGTLTAAAAALHLSQPSVSAHLRSLEDEIGTPLFLRGARGVQATARGQALARAVAEPLDALAAVNGGLAAGRVEDTVVLGGPCDLLALRALPAISTVLGMGLRLRVRTGVAEPLVDAVSAGELDAAIAVRQPHRPEIVYEPLGAERLVLVGAPSWRARLGSGELSRDPAAALADVPWLAIDEQLTFIADYCREVFAWQPGTVAAATVADLRSLARLAERGAGVTVLPSYVVQDALTSGALIELHHPRAAPRRAVALAYRPASLRRPGLSAVRDALIAAAPSWDGPGRAPHT
jgi:DNA-binding transcriptional LysR family regulator